MHQGSYESSGVSILDSFDYFVQFLLISFDHVEVILNLLKATFSLLNGLVFVVGLKCFCYFGLCVILVELFALESGLETFVCSAGLLLVGLVMSFFALNEEKCRRLRLSLRSLTSLYQIQAWPQSLVVNSDPNYASSSCSFPPCLAPAFDPSTSNCTNYWPGCCLSCSSR